MDQNYLSMILAESEPTNESSFVMREKAYELCRQYLSGEWNNISPNDMIFKTVSGGLSNLLYYCSLPSTHTPMTGEPSQVLLRMYGQLLDRNDPKITDSVITMLLSERNLGPKLYGIFPGGRLEEYIPARAMVCNELSDPNLSAIIAQKLAIVHRLNVPINKEPNWLPQTIDDFLKKIRCLDEERRQKDLMNPMEQELCSFDFETERDVMFQILAQCDSPTVFCHNDLQEGNILLPSDDKELANLIKMMNNNNSNANSQQKSLQQKFEDHIVFIDFEWCAYNFRGFDLGNHFVERMFDYSNPEWPHFHAYMDRYPIDQEKRYFIHHYLEQSKKLDQEEQDSEDQIIKEADFYALASHFLWTLWSINNARSSMISFGYLEYGKVRLEAYHQHKKYLLQTYNIKL